MKEKQMTAKGFSLAGAPSADTISWETQEWGAVESSVRRLQMRIAKAVQAGRYHKAKALQWLLTHSHHAKLLAVKRVTENRGSKTAGVDGKICRTSKQKQHLAQSLKRSGYQAQPLRRVYIPKRNSVTERRPLSIPVMKDRAMQTLYLFGLEPIAELKADPNAYGFRPARCAADAIEQCFRALSMKSSAQYILEGDIRKCFDRLDHQWLKDHIPMDKRILGQWLSAGYVDGNILYPTREGAPQGGSASPCITLMALSGLEAAVKAVTTQNDKVHVVMYADDFIVTGASIEVLENRVKPAIVSFLKERGLELSATKTKLSHINEGFDFLGHNIRKYKGKLLIKPAKKSVKAFLDTIRGIIKSHPSIKTILLIKMLNLRIRGWAYYYRHVVSQEVFDEVDDGIYRALAKWVKRRHPEKNATWWRKHYFRRQGGRNWVFSAPDKAKGQWVDLLKMKYIPIRRHIKIIAKATPYDAQWIEYFKQREQQKRRSNMILRKTYELRSGKRSPGKRSSDSRADANQP
jgi:RNA-directed DNA polymerase